MSEGHSASMSRIEGGDRMTSKKINRCDWADDDRGERIPDEAHPCTCCDSYVEFEERRVVWIKRDYYEVIEWYWCKNCWCHWNRVTYVTGQDSWIEILQPPQTDDNE